MTREHQAVEFKERYVQTHAIWLGGFFEVGGSVLLPIHSNSTKNGLRSFPIPLISFSDIKLQRLIEMQRLFGGNVLTRGTKKNGLFQEIRQSPSL